MSQSIESQRCQGAYQARRERLEALVPEKNLYSLARQLDWRRSCRLKVCSVPDRRIMASI
jgi:hypothetical protein